MTIALGVKSNAYCTPFGTSTTITTGSVTTSPTGSTFVVCIQRRSATVSSLTDSYSNTYTLKQTGTGFNNGDIYVCENGSGGAGHTVTLTVGTADNIELLFQEITGAATVSAYDAGNNGSNTSGGTTLTGASVTTTNANDMVFSFIAGYSDSGATSSTGTGWTLADSIAVSGTPSSGTSYKVVSATGSYNDVYTQAAFNYAAFAIVSIKQASGGGGNVTVGLIGQRSAFAQGAFGVSLSIPLGGVSGTSGTGTMAPGTISALSGVSSVSATGILSPSASVALTGAVLTATPGSPVPGMLLSLLGNLATFHTGVLNPSLTIPLTGISNSTGTGIITSSGGDVIVTQTGSLLLIRRGSRKKR